MSRTRLRALLTLLLPVAAAGCGGSPTEATATPSAVVVLTAANFQRVVLESSLPVLHLSQNVVAPARPASHAFRIALEERAGDETLLFVRADGDLKERFSGYSIALDYDESLLTYVRFEVPVDFESLASFTTCPDDAGDGCGPACFFEVLAVG